MTTCTYSIYDTLFVCLNHVMAFQAFLSKVMETSMQRKQVLFYFRNEAINQQALRSKAKMNN